MTSLPEFMRERLAEREAVARAAMVGDGRWHAGDYSSSDSFTDTVRATGEDYVGDLADEHIQRHVIQNDPAFVLADCEAKRLIIEVDERNRTDLMRETGTYAWTTRAIALPHVTHPDYREEWKP